MATIECEVMVATMPEEDYQKAIRATAEVCSFIGLNNQLPSMRENREFDNSLDKLVSVIFETGLIKMIDKSDSRIKPYLVNGIKEYLDTLEIGQDIDAHAVYGYGYRQISMLALEDILKR